MPHNYSSFVEILTEKADSWRHYCICAACSEVNGRSNALLNKFPNKSERIRNHLKKCQHFKEMYPDQFAELFVTEDEEKDDNTVDNTVKSKKRIRKDSSGSVYSSISRTSMF
jgi:hypothetical protein